MHTNANTPSSLTYVLDEQLAQLQILQHALSEVLYSDAFRDADPPMLDVLYVLNEHFGNLIKPN